jgi:hypothetical protein
VVEGKLTLNGEPKSKKMKRLIGLFNSKALPSMLC